MTDIIEDALAEWQDETEREATGTVDGHNIRLVKEEYQMEQRGPTAWKVGVYVDGDEPLATKSKKELSAEEAQNEFERLVEKHGLDQ